MTDSDVLPFRRPAAGPRPLAERDDEALMTLAAGDHRPAFEVLVARYLPRVGHYCAKFAGDVRIGEELAQEVLLEAWEQRRRYRPQGKFPVFLFTIARNRCLNQVRGESRRRRWERRVVAEAPPPLAGASPDQLDLLLEEEERRRVRAALLELPVKLREAVLLRFDQGLGYAEIARIVGRSETAVRSRVFLALRRLRAEVSERRGA